MAGLQRSVETFRRSGSSGLVWEDRYLSELAKSREDGVELREMRASHSVGTIGLTERNGSNNDGGRPYATVKVSPAIDPPSPKLTGCGLCGILRNPKPTKGSNKPGRRR